MNQLPLIVMQIDEIKIRLIKKKIRNEKTPFRKKKSEMETFTKFSMILFLIVTKFLGSCGVITINPVLLVGQ